MLNELIRPSTIRRGYDDAVTMRPRYIVAAEIKATSVSSMTRLRNIVRGFPLGYRNLLFTVQAARTTG